MNYSKHKASKGTYQWLAMIDNFLQELRKNDLPAVSVRAGSFLVVTQIENSYSTLNMLNSMVQQANFIRMLSKKVGISSVSIGISNPSKKLQPISDLFEQATKACSMRVLIGLNRNISYSTIANKVKIFDKQILEKKIKRIKQLLYARDEQCLPLINSLYSINLMDGFMEINYFKYLNNRLFSLAQGYAEQFEAATIGANLDFETMESLETVQEMQALFTQVFQYLLNCESQMEEDAGSLVERTKKHVGKNYEKDISLCDIADKMKVHKGYLSRIFKEQTGKNLMQYIVEKKIERAKVLLKDTPMKLGDIAKNLGFTTPQYFCIVFKKNAGLTPQEYRSTVHCQQDT
ncbi:AraC family transcriptional regulator [Hydrogenoanaerobacterium sp.]|uniref:AraC family transcriptional regulator n=1 Tax=Hydrogenoanaerobacterium sp. TaxID=2953763 RepID=UPI00289EFA7B|nr:AraC family transcriptional regulator [Hydrogenoanaerobacterium sp.]